MGSIYLPYQKPPRWNISPNGIAYNCARMGLPIPKLTMPFWGGGNKAFDYSGNNISGTLTGGPIWSDGGIYFDGNNDYINCSSPEVLKITDSLTYSCLVKFTASQSNKCFMIYYTPGSPYDGVALGIHDSIANKIKWVGDSLAATGTTALNDGAWHHIVGTFDGNILRIYVDGKYDAQIGNDTISYTATSAFNIGAWKAGSQHFDGTIRIPIVFDQALTANQVRTLYNNPYGMFEPIRKSVWIVPLALTTTAPTTTAPTTVAPTTPTLPTTIAPTTIAPTTSAPTTAAPTLAPTTVAPTTQAPTTPSPTTAAPTTVAPTTVAPTTLAPPTTAAPTTSAPTTGAPTPAPTTVAPTPTPTTIAPTTLAPTTPAPPPTTLAPTTVAPPTTLAPTTPTLTTLAPTTAPPEEICIKELNSVITKEIFFKSIIIKEMKSNGHLC